MTITTSAPTAKEILEAWGGRLGGRVPPDKCSSAHRPLTRCATCGNTPPRGALNDLPDTPRELRWSFWYSQNTYTTGTPSDTTPEHRAEMEAATARYLEARAAWDRASDEYIGAIRAERKAKHIIWNRSGPVTEGGPELIARARDAKDDASVGLLAAEEAAAEALRDLNEACIPPAQRRQRQRSIAESLRRMVFG